MLKRYYITIISVLVFSLQGLYSQNINDIINAFGESYSYEKEGNYSEALKSLKKSIWIILMRSTSDWDGSIIWQDRIPNR